MTRVHAARGLATAALSLWRYGDKITTEKKKMLKINRVNTASGHAAASGKPTQLNLSLFCLLSRLILRGSRFTDAPLSVWRLSQPHVNETADCLLMTSDAQRADMTGLSNNETTRTHTLRLNGWGCDLCGVNVVLIRADVREVN